MRLYILHFWREKKSKEYPQPKNGKRQEVSGRGRLKYFELTAKNRKGGVESTTPQVLIVLNCQQINEYPDCHLMVSHWCKPGWSLFLEFSTVGYRKYSTCTGCARYCRLLSEFLEYFRLLKVFFPCVYLFVPNFK